MKNKKVKIIILVCGLLVIAAVVGYLLGKGKVYSIKLEGNATTGYEWNCTLSQEGIIKEIDTYYTSNEAKDGEVGTPGVWTYKFKAIKPGTVILTCDYERSFEEDSSVETKIYPLEIDKDLNVKGLY